MTIMNMSESEQFDIIREASNYLNVLVNMIVSYLLSPKWIEK